jgi:flagellar protein FliS
MAFTEKALKIYLFLPIMEGTPVNGAVSMLDTLKTALVGSFGIWEEQMAYTNALSAYKETKIRTASQGQLIMMLYDEAVKQLNGALELMGLNVSGKKDPGRIEYIGKAISKAQDILAELMVSLDFEQGGEIAKNLFALYSWFNKELLEAHIDQDLTRVTIVRNQINELREAWNEVAAKSVGAGRPREGVNIAG